MSRDQQEAWFALMRVTLRLSYELNRQLRADTTLSLNDYHVLNALADSPGRQLAVTALAARIAWERSRLSHHLQRMSARGLVSKAPSSEDRRATEIVLTEAGHAALLAATPSHVDWVRTLVFDGLEPELVAPLRTALEQMHAQLVTHGALPSPGPPQHHFADPDAHP